MKPEIKAVVLAHKTEELAQAQTSAGMWVAQAMGPDDPPWSFAFYKFENRGFTANWNKVMRHLITDHDGVQFVWMLNSDVVGATPWMADFLVTQMRMEWDAGRLAGVITPRFNSPHSDFSTKTHTSLRAVQWIDWCCPMVSVRAWQDVGEFDERFDGYGADLDWCKRARNRGWQMSVSEDQYIYHIGQQTANVVGKMWDYSLMERNLREKWGVSSWQEMLS